MKAKAQKRLFGYIRYQYTKAKMLERMNQTKKDFFFSLSLEGQQEIVSRFAERNTYGN